jgi:hypothetical protein
MFRSQKPQPFILTRTYGQVYTASQECIFDLPAPKKDISDVYYSNGPKPSYYRIKDDVTGKRKFADAFTQVGFDKVELRDLKKECMERKKLVAQLFEAFDNLEGIEAIGNESMEALRQMAFTCRAVNSAISSIPGENIPDGQCLNLSGALELPGRIGKTMTSIGHVLRRTATMVEKRNQFMDLNEDLTSRFLREIVNLFVDDEVDVEGLGGNFGMKSFSLKREHMSAGGGKVEMDAGSGGVAEGMEGDNVWTLFEGPKNTEVSSKKKKKVSPQRKRQPLRAARINSGKPALGMIPTDEADIPDTQGSDAVDGNVDVVADDVNPDLSDDATRESEEQDLDEDDASAQRLQEEHFEEAARKGRPLLSPDGSSYEPTPRSQETNSTMSSHAPSTSDDDDGDDNDEDDNNDRLVSEH